MMLYKPVKANWPGTDKETGSGIIIRIFHSQSKKSSILGEGCTNLFVPEARET